MSPRALTWLGVAAVLLLIGAAAATVLVVGAALPPTTPGLDDRYVASVRTNSTLTSHDIDDVELVRTGHQVCDILDRRPTVQTALAIMHGLGRVPGWTDDDAAAVLGSAIGAYCPRHIPVISR